MSSLSVRSPMGPRFAPVVLLTTLALLGAAACAEGDGIEAATSTSGPGGGDDTSSGGAPATSTSGAEVGSSSSSTSGGPGATTTTTSGGGAGGGGEGGGVSTGGGEGGLGGEGGEGGSAPVPVCGDGILNGVEACDTLDLGGATCTSIGEGFIGGALACTGGCSFDTTACTSPPSCGNGVVEGTEECDGAALGGATCATEGFTSGTVSCTAGCAIDASACWTCGDGQATGPELCDGADLEGVDCVALGHDGGTLTCAADCMAFVQNACSDCGDMQVEAPEACDGTNFAGATCASMGFTGGTLLCNGTCSTVSTAGCYTCGDGAIGGAEVCDGASLGGQTCVTLGYDAGTLGCNGGCLSYNVSGCFDYPCNDGLDNDGDGYVDLADLGCTAASDTSESIYAPSCNGVGGPIYDVSFADTSDDIVLSGNNAGFPDATDAPCQSNTGPEVAMVYRNVAFESDIIISTDFSGTATAFDTVLTVRRGTCNAASATCNDDIGLGNTRSRVQIFNVQPGELLFITLEGWNGQTGEFDVLIDLESNDF